MRKLSPVPNPASNIETSLWLKNLWGILFGSMKTWMDSRYPPADEKYISLKSGEKISPDSLISISANLNSVILIL